MAMVELLRRASASGGRSALRYLQMQAKSLTTHAASGAAASRGKLPLAQGFSRCSSSNHQPLLRFMSSGSDGGLLRVLKSEIEHEAEEGKTQEIENAPPKPFTMQDKAGTQEIILRRSYGSEDIAITCVYQNDPYADPSEEEDDDDDDEDEPVSRESVHMTVSISKGGDKPVLEIGCLTSGEDVTIERVAYLENGSEKELVYDGPEFVELDEDLQKQFQKFLDARGINEDLGNFLMRFMPGKERQEYVRWLKNVEAFLKM